MRMGRWLKILAIAPLFLGAPAAADSVPTVSWQCWYHKQAEGPSVICRLLQAPDTGTVASTETAPPTVTHRIRTQPASLGDQIVQIPLYSPSEDMSRVARLARAVMCGGQAACTVDFIPAQGS